MAAMSAASAAANTITPPSSSHGNGNQNSWNHYTTGDAVENSLDKKYSTKTDQTNPLPLTQNGASANLYEYGFEPLPPAKRKASVDNLSSKGSRSWERGNSRGNDSAGKPGLSNTDDVFGGKGTGLGEKQSTNDLVAAGGDDSSKWIHRDKLARIESEELQAAGIILPRQRASSRPRRGRSEEKLNGSIRRNTSVAADDEVPRPRSRKGSSVSPENRVPMEKVPDLDASAWDLRRLEEIATEGDGNYWTSGSEKKGTSKIPVAKSAKRNVTDTSPRKGSGASSTTRKTSTQVKSTGKHKVRGGKDSTSNTGGSRTTSKSTDLSPATKQPEGDPPWMIGSYKPDPRLPPDQQLLPTVAKRLQQEQWEREGKFGSIYDREFRPLTSDGLLRPPESGPSTFTKDEEKQGQQSDEWPLRTDAPPKSPTSPGIKTSTSYSTMPKLSDKPQISPLPSPRSPRSPMTHPQLPAQTQTITRVPDQPSAVDMSMGGNKKKSGGCGCCIVM